MEFQESLKFMFHKPMHKKWVFDKETEPESFAEVFTSSPRRKWGIFHRSSSTIASKSQSKLPPKEFICPISGSLMADPVIVSSGHTFERASVQACKNLSFTPILSDGSTPDFSSVIPNLALKSAINNWCKSFARDPPKPPDSSSADKLVRTLMASQNPKPDAQNKAETQKVVITEKDLIQMVKENPPVNFNHAATEVTRRPTHFYSDSQESVGTTSSTPPLQLSTRPSCYSSPSSSEIEIQSHSSPEEEEIMKKLKSPQVVDIEEAVISLRNITRTREDTRIHLCSPRLLSAIRSLIVSKYTTVQVNSVAAMVNLSLEKMNKVKIVRSGIVPPLIDVLKGGFPEAQEHASGALFSLALDDDNKTAIGVLGALPPLLHLLRSESERTRQDSALALYHLSLVQSNRTKLVKLGSVTVLLGMVKLDHMTGRVLLILCNLGSSVDGRAAMLDAGAVECLIGLLSGNELESGSTRESCVAVLYALSHGGLRFKALAKAAGVVDVLRKVENWGSERGREKVRRILEMMRGREEEEEDADWEELLDWGLGSRTRSRLGGVMSESSVNSSEF
ncbi:RING-type E3 ubiquitin transferase [Quillaja saponaria]|uniref:RING-type E3 ubiquitin transferase n=1 Tax=Quillaja saponaria TaxID=32244 RepID=A0AAD7VG02_QUISA|nr:RING-type E3 ubiquitin transferase [Quillaja saponaria]